MTEIECPFCGYYNWLYLTEREIDGSKQKLTSKCKQCKAKLTLTAIRSKEIMT